VASVLSRAQIPYAAVERDPELVHRMRDEGHNVILGDAMDPVAFDRLVAAHIEAVVITVPESSAADIIAQRVRARTQARVIARARRRSDVEDLQANGASIVLVPEVEGALSFADAALRALDVPAESVERQLVAERDSIMRPGSL
jgi:monovalent cation:H+ antiporter-2, CPA2 family